MGTTRRSVAVLGAFAAMFATSPGQTFVISNFTESIGESLELQPSTLAGAYLIGTLMSAASLTHAGRLADRIGPRHMMGIASVGLAAAGFALSRASGFASLALAFFMLRFFGQGVLVLASSHALALRFHGKLGTVEGLKGAVFSGAIAIMPQVAVAMVAAYGWRDAAWRLALGCAGVAFVSAYVLLDKDPGIGAAARGRAASKSDAKDVPDEAAESGFTLAEARRTRPFWVLVAAGSFTGAVLTAVHFHLTPILGEAGLSKELAAATFVAFAAGGFVSTLLGGVWVDRRTPAPILAAGLVFLLVGMSATALAETSWMGYAGMAALGGGHGLVGSVVGTTLARFFGRAHHGAIRGASTTAVVAGAAAGPYIVGLLAEAVGGYSTATVALAVVFLPLPIVAWTLKPPSTP